MQNIKKLLGLLLLGISVAAMASAPTPGSVKWTFGVQGKVDAGLAVGADGTVYVPSEDLHLWAVNPDGTKKWAFPVAYPIAGSPLIGNNGNVFIASRVPLSYAENAIYSISPAGSQNWKVVIGTTKADCGPAAPPIVVNQLVASGLGFMSYSSGHDVIGVSRLAECETISILPSKSSYGMQFGVTFLQPETGKVTNTQWYDVPFATSPGSEAPSSVLKAAQDSLTSPFIAESSIVMMPVLNFSENWSRASASVIASVYSAGSNLNSIARTNGSTVQFSHVGGKADVSTYFFSDSLGNLEAFKTDGHTGSSVWRQKLAGNLTPAAPTVDAQNHIDVVSSNGYLYSMNIDGTINWTLFVDKSGLSRSAVIAKDGSLYVTANNGNVYAVTPKGKMKWSQPAQVNASTAPVVGPDGTVYVGTDLGTVVAINP